MAYARPEGKEMAIFTFLCSTVELLPSRLKRVEIIAELH